MVKTKLGLKNVSRGFKNLQRNAEQGFIVIFWFALPTNPKLSREEASSETSLLDSVFLFALLSDRKSIESVPIENAQGLWEQISIFSWQN